MGLDNRVVTGADKLRNRIATIRRSVALPVLVDQIGALLLRRVKVRFDQGVTADGAKWPELSAVTKADKDKLGFGGKGMLRRTDEMRNSIKLIRGNVTGTTFTNTGGGVRIGIENPAVISRARAHNRGVTRMKIPARRFLQIGSSDVKAVDSLMRRKSETLMR
jgi:phage gpG-like protein